MTLLRQVAADAPFTKERGKLKKAWEELAQSVMQCAGFSRELDGKKAQNRFLALIEEHQSYNNDSAKLSGVDQSETEKVLLLDDLLSLYDDIKVQSTHKSSVAQVEKDRIEQDWKLIRDEAINTLGKRQRRDNENKRDSLAMAISENSSREFSLREKEFELKRSQLEADIKERESQRFERDLDREKRRYEREHQLALAKIQAQSTSEMIKAILQNKQLWCSYYNVKSKLYS
ncbi:hypothetical protein AC1031_008346 [Aphanomyces cochlioides]|nr:hypothetical protein AC1031_008346 [Aphanomyces cochlioides]